MWLVLLIVVLVVLAVMFGGFQKGTKTGSLNHSPAVTFTFSPAGKGGTSTAGAAIF
jgi:Kef-type K+ transport system membrane component KefB